MLNVESNENEPAEPMQTEEDDNEPPSKKRRKKRHESVSKSYGSKKNDDEQRKMQQQRSQKQPANKLGRPKLNKSVRTEHDSPLIEQHQQQPKPKKRRRQKYISIETNPIAKNPKAESAAASTATERTMNRVENVRKRENRHEFLVTWANDDTAEWISRDLMATKYAQHLIAYFERITKFKQLTTTN